MMMMKVAMITAPQASGSNSRCLVGLVGRSSIDGGMVSNAQTGNTKSLSLVQLESSKTKVHAFDDTVSRNIDVATNQLIENKTSETQAFENGSGLTPIVIGDGSSNNPINATDASIQEDTLTKELEKTFERAEKENRNLRFGIMVCTVVSGLVMLVTFTVLALTVSQNFWALLAPCIFLMLLGVMPSDIVTIRVLSFVAVLAFLFFAYRTLSISHDLWFTERREAPNDELAYARYGCGDDLPNAGCAVWAVFRLVHGVNNLVTGLGIGANLIPSFKMQFFSSSRPKGFRYKDAAFRTPARASLERAWCWIRFWVLVWGFLDIVTALVSHSLQDRAPMHTNDILTTQLLVGSVNSLTVGLFNDNNRRHIMAFFTRMVVDQEASSAASVAALIGGINPKDGLALAKKKFRTIPFSVLKKEDFKSNRGEKGKENRLFHETKECALGAGDAFMSHSWSDDGPEKYQALKDWADDFKNREGRYPNIWLDKACIDQTDIESDLLCLPIFLAGCKELVLFPGPTYASRLWCIMEVFTFLKMGGSADRITILPIKQTETEAKRMFKTVDVRKCECYDDNDRQKLLGIIERCFGDYETFNTIVHEVFTDRVSQVVTIREKQSQRETLALSGSSAPLSDQSEKTVQPDLEGNESRSNNVQLLTNSLVETTKDTEEPQKTGLDMGHEIALQ